MITCKSNRGCKALNFCFTMTFVGIWGHTLVWFRIVRPWSRPSRRVPELKVVPEVLENPGSVRRGDWDPWALRRQELSGIFLHLVVSPLPGVRPREGYLRGGRGAYLVPLGTRGRTTEGRKRDPLDETWK